MYIFAHNSYAQAHTMHCYSNLYGFMAFIQSLISCVILGYTYCIPVCDVYIYIYIFMSREHFCVWSYTWNWPNIYYPTTKIFAVCRCVYFIYAYIYIFRTYTSTYRYNSIRISGKSLDYYCLFFWSRVSAVMVMTCRRTMF
jgi:hypothetical protein